MKLAGTLAVLCLGWIVYEIARDVRAYRRWRDGASWN